MYRTCPQPESARPGCARRRGRADAQAYSAGRPGCHGSAAAARALGRGSPGCSSAALASEARGGGGWTEAPPKVAEADIAAARLLLSAALCDPARPRPSAGTQGGGSPTPGLEGRRPVPPPGLPAAHLSLSVRNRVRAPPCPLLHALLNRTYCHETKDCSSGSG